MSGDPDNGCGLDLRGRACSPLAISPGAGTFGSLSWRFMRTADRRRPALGEDREDRFRVRELLEEPGEAVSDIQEGRGKRVSAKQGRLPQSCVTYVVRVRAADRRSWLPRPGERWTQTAGSLAVSRCGVQTAHHRSSPCERLAA